MVQYSFFLQDSFGPLMSHISSFHDHVMIVVLMILTVVLYVNLVIFSSSFMYGRLLKSSEGLETMWTVLPCLVLGSLAAPSLMTLYLSDELSNPVITVKVIGHQWYWSYEYESGIYSFDSYMVPSESLKPGDFRLLEVDKSVKIPLNSESRVFVTSSDVIHSWTIPSLGVKVDAVPGRLNQLCIYPSRLGKVYGQCSEICGSMHSFMPICLDIVPQKEFFGYINV